MTDDSWPLYIPVCMIVVIMIINSLVVASKRALDYIDRNAIKEMLEDEPENKRLQAVTGFLAKPSKYHYADHAASFISIIAAFMIFNSFMYHRVSAPLLAACNLGFYIIYTSLSDILPKKLAEGRTQLGLFHHAKGRSRNTSLPCHV